MCRMSFNMKLVIYTSMVCMDCEALSEPSANVGRIWAWNHLEMLNLLIVAYLKPEKNNPVNESKYTYMYIYKHTRMYMYVYVYICMYAYVCV